MTRAVRPGLLAAVLTLAMAAGCSDDDSASDGSADRGPTSTTVAASTSSTTGPAPETTTTAFPAPRALPIFQTPTGNIICLADAETGVDCEIGEYSFTPPPKEPSCDLDWGQRLFVGPVGVGFVCYGDTLRGEPGPVLAYGETSRVGDYECVSREGGLRCSNTKNGRGFVLARARYEFF